MFQTLRVIKAKYYNIFPQKLRQRTIFTKKTLSKKKITEDEFKKVFNELESYTKIWLFLPKYSLQNISEKEKILKTLSVIFTIIYLVRSFVLSINHGPVYRFYLGDMFNYHDENDAKISTLFAEGLFIFGSVEVFYYFKEKQAKMTSLKLIDKLKYKPYDVLKREMRPEIAENCARAMHKAIKVQLRRIPATSSLISGIVTYYYYENTETYESFACFMLKMIWFFIGLICIVYSIRTAYGLSLYALLLIFWWKFFTESLIKDGIELSNSKIMNSRRLKIYYLGLNRVANKISTINIQFWFQIMIWYLVGSLVCDTAIFVSVFFSLKSVAVKIAFHIIALSSIMSMSSLNLISAQLIKKIQCCHKVTYRIMRRHRLILTDSFKMLSVIERFSSHQIGIYVVDTILLDYRCFLLFLVENTSILLLLISNIQRRR